MHSTFCDLVRIKEQISFQFSDQESIFAVEPGATVTVNGILLLALKSPLNIGGILTDKCSISIFEGSSNLLPGGTVDLEVMYEDEANKLAGMLGEYATVEKIDDGDYIYRVTAHVHDFSKGDCPCGETTPAASTLSKGSVWIVGAVASVAAIVIGAIVIVRKKKNTAVADGADNTDKE